MRGSTRLAILGLLVALPVAASAQSAPDGTVKAIDRAGEAAAEQGAPGTVVADTPGVAVAPGIQAPVETPVAPSSPPQPGTPAQTAK